MITNFEFSAIAFLIIAGVALVGIQFWIRKAHQIGLIWTDMNKIKGGQVAGSGGLTIILAFVIGVLVYVQYRTFYLRDVSFSTEIFALLTSVLLLAGVGLVDDLLGWQRGGLGRTSRLVLVLIAAFPLMAINVGRSTIALPFLGQVDLGLVYALIIIPIGIIGAGTTFNFLAGFNGLEAGQGILILGASAVVSYFTGSVWLAVICILMIAALLVFLLFNFYPARVFPGDVLTYPVGGLFAIVAILGNFEKIAVFFFIPYILEVILKSRGKLIKQSFGLPKSDGSIALRYPKVYSLNHVAILGMERLGIKVTEQRVVFFVWSFQLLVIATGLVIFRGGIFI